MAKDKDATGKVTLYRLKAKLDLVTTTIADYEPRGEGKNKELKLLYRLWAINPKEVPASWFGPFKELAKPYVPKTRSGGFIFFVNTDDATYAFVGGIGWTKLIKDFEVEARFGITVGKRILTKLTALRGLHQRDVSGSVHTIDRSFRRAHNPKLDIDNLHRMLRQLKGGFEKESAEYKEIGSSINATASLAVNGSKTFADMLRFVVTVDKLWKSDVVGLDIPELREINKRIEKDLIGKLRLALAEEIAKFKDPKYKDQLPDLFLDHFDVGYLPDRVLKYEVSYRKKTVHETHRQVLERVAEILAAPKTPKEKGEPVDRLDSITIKMQLEEDAVAGPFKLMKLMCGDVSYDGESYFIDGGDWFKADDDFKAQLNKHLAMVPCLKPEDLGLKVWKVGDDEEAYNKTHAGKDTVILDRKLVRIPSESGGIEFCDILALDGDAARLIHVKHATGAELRALLAQGQVSALLYTHSTEFSDKVHTADVDRAKDLSATERASMASLEKVEHAKKWVIYAILDDTASHKPAKETKPTTTGLLDGTLSLFAKVDLFSRVRSIRELGMQVAVTRIKPYPA